MELDDLNGDLRGDLNDLWATVQYLGKQVEEFDAELGGATLRFNRPEEWREALNSLRKLLKKHHSSESFPVRRKLADWDVFKQKLAPMISLFYDER